MKKWIGILLAMCLVMGLLPGVALAAGDEARYSTDGGVTWHTDSLIDAIWAGYQSDIQIELLRSVTLVDQDTWSEGLALGNTGYTLTLDGKGYTLTRGSGINKVATVVGDKVTLKNITIDGGAVWSSNDPATRTNSGLSFGGNAHLFEVDSGCLILENGAVLQNSHLNGNTGGAAVRVMSGKLIIKTGAELRNNSAASGGGAIYQDAGASIEIQGGMISGNYTNGGGGAIQSNGTVSLSGGEISGNASGNNGGGVCISGGTFTMSAGKIVYNKTTAGGGGITILGGSASLVVQGGEISGNTITGSLGGGVLVNAGSLSVSGNPNISGNTAGTAANNVYLNSGNTIQVTGTLDASASIGVTTKSVPAKDVPVSITSQCAEDYSGNFISDKDYDIINGENNVVQITPKACTVTFDVNGGEWRDTAMSETSTVYQGETISEPTAPTKTVDGTTYRFDGWYTDNDTFANKYDFSASVSGNLALYAKWVEQHTANITIIGQNGQTYTNVSAKLMPLGEASAVGVQDNLTGDSGNPVKYSYSVMVDAGQYNLVVTATETASQKELTVTTLENLKSDDVTQDIYLPESNKSSVVDDNSGLGVIAGGVNTIAAGQTPAVTGGHLEVQLPIASGYDPTTETTDKPKIEAQAQTDNKTIEQVLDIDLLLYQYNENDNPIGGATNLGGNNTTPLEILIPIDTTGKTADGFAVYRVHNGVLHTLPYNGESFSVDIDEGFIKLNAKLFSSYAIAYGTSSSGGPNPDPGTGGGEPDPGPSGTPPVIVDPTNNWGVIAYVGETASMGITAFGANTYQWYVDRGDGKGFVPIPGATGPSYTTSPVTMDNDGYVYRCVAMNAYGQATSPNITLDVFDYMSIPKTGDNSHLGLYIGLMMIGLAGIGFSAMQIHRRKREN